MRFTMKECMAEETWVHLRRFPRFASHGISPPWPPGTWRTMLQACDGSRHPPSRVMLRSTGRPCKARWRHVCQSTGHWLPLRPGGQCRASGEPGRNLVALRPLKMIVAFAWPLAAGPLKLAAFPPFSAAQRRCRISGGQDCTSPAALCGPLRAAQGQSALRPVQGAASVASPGWSQAGAGAGPANRHLPTPAIPPLGGQACDPALFSYSISQVPPFGRTGRGADICPRVCRGWPRSPLPVEIRPGLARIGMLTTVDFGNPAPWRAGSRSGLVFLLDQPGPLFVRTGRVVDFSASRVRGQATLRVRPARALPSRPAPEPWPAGRPATGQGGTRETRLRAGRLAIRPCFASRSARSALLAEPGGTLDFRSRVCRGWPAPHCRSTPGTPSFPCVQGMA